MNIKLKNYLLEDDETPYGGTEFEGETLGEFCEEIGLDLETTSLKEVNESLVECGIKPIPDKVIRLFDIIDVEHKNDSGIIGYFKKDLWLDASLFKSTNRNQLLDEIVCYLEKKTKSTINNILMEVIDSKGLDDEFNKLGRIIRHLPEDEKKSFSNKILSLVSEYVGGYDLIYQANKKFDRYDVGSRLSLQELIEVGFNNIDLTYYCNGELESKTGYCESDFEELNLGVEVEITGFYHDAEDFLCVEAKTIHE